MTGSADQDEMPGRVARLAFGAGALLGVLVGLGLYVFSDVLGLHEETAEILAIAFLVAGVGDYLILHFWDRIFRRD